jgi:signal transduction histidine kinase
MGPRGVGAGLAVRGRFILLLVICILLTGISGLYFARSLAKPNTGLVDDFPQVTVSGGRLLFSPKVLFSPAAAAGLLANRDEILAVNGTPVRTTWDVVREDGRVRNYSPITVQVRRDGGDVLTFAFTPELPLTRPDWAFALLFASALAAVAFILTIRTPDGSWTVPLVLAALSYLVFTCVKPFYYESLLSNSLIHMGKLTSWLLVLFGLSFPRPRGPGWLRPAASIAIVCVYAVFIAARIGLYRAWAGTGQELWLDRYRALGQAGNISDGAAYLTWAALMITAYLRSGMQVERKQVQWFLAGILISLPPYFFFEQVPLILGRGAASRISLGSFSELFLVFIPVCALIGLTRHRMVNLRFLLSRYALYGTLFLLMFLLFSLGYMPLREALSTGYGLASPLRDFLASAALLVILVPLRFLLARLGSWLLWLPHRGSRHASREELQRRNLELSLILEQLRVQGRRTLRAEELGELRVILRGVSRRIRASLRDISAGLTWASEDRGERLQPGMHAGPGGAPLDAAMQASIRLGDFARALEAMAGNTASISALASPGDLVRAAVERTRARHPGAAFTVGQPPTARIACRPAELIEALCLLMDNAVEARPGSPAPVKVEMSAEADRLSIEITDCGPGLPLLASGRLFRPFFSTKPGHEGLGLYFARLITERAGGGIRVDGPPGAGVRVRLDFPIARDGAGSTP